MLEIVTTDPVLDSQGFYLDKNITIEFNKALNSAFTTDEFFKLYKIVERENQADDYQQVLINVSRSPDSKTVSLDPGVDLVPENEYQLLVRGDTNISNGIPEGIRSVDDDILDGNFILKFITGIDKMPSTEDNVPQREIIEESVGEEEISTTELESDLYVLDSSPVEDLQVNVRNLQNTEVTFNREIHVISSKVISIKSRSLDPITMPRIPLVADEVAVSGDILDITHSGFVYPDGDVLNTTRPIDYAGEEYLLPYNHEYEITVRKDYVTDKAVENKLVKDYVLQFTSLLKPLYSDVYEVREAGRGYIPDDISDYIIWKMIHTNSKHIAKYFGINYYHDLDTKSAMYKKVYNYVTCKSAYDVLNSPMLFRGGNNSKTLGDLSVSYNNSGDSLLGVKEVMDSLKDCFKMQKSDDGRFYSSGVKSKTDCYYPGRNSRGI